MKTRNLFFILVASVAVASNTFGGTERPKWETLPFGSIQAEGWLKDELRIEADGIGGHLGEIEPDMVEKPYQTRDYDTSKGGCCNSPQWCAEISAEYWLGFVGIAYGLDDPALKARADRWMERALALQEKDGYLGSMREKDDRYGPFVGFGTRLFYRTILYYYERTKDPRYLDAVHRGMLWFVDHWTAEKRPNYCGITLVDEGSRIAELTGDRRIAAWCDEYADWMDSHDGENAFDRQTLRYGYNHVGATSTRADLPAALSVAKLCRRGSIKAAEDHIAEMDRDVGWQANYGPATDFERTAMPSCVGETEYCDITYYFEYFLRLARLTGKDDYATRAERILFNVGMGQRRKDDRAVAYTSSPNQFNATETSGRYLNEAYAPNTTACCCSANSVRIWAEYLRQAILKDASGNYRIQLFGPLVARDAGNEIRMTTEYPFGKRIVVEVKGLAQKGVIAFRRPAWADDMKVERAADGSRYTVDFVYGPVVRAVQDRDFTWTRLRTVEYGPLVFAQPLKEKWTPTRPNDMYNGELPNGWSWFNVTCAEKPVVYAISPEAAYQGRGIEVVGPRHLRVPMLRASAAYAGDPAAAAHNPIPLENPVRPDDGAQVEMVDFVPYWQTTLRVTCFPVALRPPTRPVLMPKVREGTFPAQDGFRLEAGDGDLFDRLVRALKVETVAEKARDRFAVRAEEYWLTVGATGLCAKVRTRFGASRALATLRQLAKRTADGAVVIPACEIHDFPENSYRALRLDETQRSFGKACVKKQLDLMHFHKINWLHWRVPEGRYSSADIAEVREFADVRGIGVVLEPKEKGPVAVDPAEPHRPSRVPGEGPFLVFDAGRSAFDLPQWPKRRDGYAYRENGRIVSIADAYRVNPARYMPKEAQDRVIGAIAELDGMFAETPRELEWKTWPRACAYADALWSCGTGGWWRPLNVFKDRLDEHLSRLKDLGVNYAPIY